MQINGIGNGGIYRKGNSTEANKRKVPPPHPAQAAVNGSASSKSNKKPPIEDSKRMQQAVQQNSTPPAAFTVSSTSSHRESERYATPHSELSPHALRALSAYQTQLPSIESETSNQLMGVDLYV